MRLLLTAMVPVRPLSTKIWIIFNETELPKLNEEVGALRSYCFTLTYRKQRKRNLIRGQVPLPSDKQGRVAGEECPLSLPSCFLHIALARRFEGHPDMIDPLFGAPHLLTALMHLHFSLQANSWLLCRLVEHLPQVCSTLTLIPVLQRKTNFNGFLCSFFPPVF